MVDLLLAAGAAPDAGADAGGRQGVRGGGGDWGYSGWGCNGIEENIYIIIERDYIYIYNSIFLFTSTFPMILYNENISKWGYVDVFGI